MFIVEGSRHGQPFELAVSQYDEAVRAAAWAVDERAFSPRRILSDGGRVIVDERKLAGMISRLIASGSPLV